MFYNYKSTSVLLISMPEEKDPIQVNPGVHQMPTKSWNKLLSHPDIGKKLEDRMLEVVSDAEDKPLAEVLNVTEMSPKQCFELIEGISDLRTLESMLNNEIMNGGGRDTIREMINNQINLVRKVNAI